MAKRYVKRSCLTELFAVRIVFKKFCSGDFSPKDDKLYARPVVDEDKMKAIIESNRVITVPEIAKILNVSHITREIGSLATTRIE